jgi:MORN repeat
LRKACSDHVNNVLVVLQGGMYEGEWSKGVMSGLGVKTLGSGKVKVRGDEWSRGEDIGIR